MGTYQRNGFVSSKVKVQQAHIRYKVSYMQSLGSRVYSEVYRMLPVFHFFTELLVPFWNLVSNAL
jgi:NADH/NAD ratio-sensing transcriptional regulator Rex